MEPKIKNATFATQSNPYQNMRYNSNKDNPNCIFQVGDAFGFFFLYEKLDAYT